jgi:hypothetical protein
MFSTVSSKTSAVFPFFITDNAVLISSYVGSGISSCVAPLNAAFLLEEARREALDIGKLLTIVLLDAKSAFDVVVHKNLLKKLYNRVIVILFVRITWHGLIVTRKKQN